MQYALSRPANNNCFFSFFLLDEILKRQKANLEELDEGNEKAPEKESLESKVNEGSESDNPASSVPDLSSPQPESEDGNSASEKLVADGKASVLCVVFLSVLFNITLMVQDLICNLTLR